MPNISSPVKVTGRGQKRLDVSGQVQDPEHWAGAVQADPRGAGFQVQRKQDLWVAQEPALACPAFVSSPELTPQSAFCPSPL